jgi:hypothetical protein
MTRSDPRRALSDRRGFSIALTANLSRQLSWALAIAVALTGLVLAGLLVSVAVAESLSPNELMSFLVQSVCLDAGGQIRRGLPIDADCLIRQAQSDRDVATYRKYDWPNSNEAVRRPLGYQASDSVIMRRGGRSFVEQTFDFGDQTRAFGHFDTGLGDGGQVLVVVQGWASAIMTEDGGDGIQYFIGPGCRNSTQPAAGELSWLFFNSDIERGQWNSTLARLNKGHLSTECPTVFNAALTRYRLESIDVPFRISATSERLTETTKPIDVIISEHYGGEEMTSADHLERFYFARDLGLIRWERWENFAAPKPPALVRMAEQFAQTGRCRPWAYSTAVGPQWQMIDCRNWTTLVASTQWSVGDYRWTALDALGPPE